jgi:hypothetical protein
LCGRLGITSVEALALDATKVLLAPEAREAIENGGKVGGWPAGTFDRILLDPPCSGLGTGYHVLLGCVENVHSHIRWFSGNRPRLKDTQSWSALQNHAAYQRKLIHTAVPLLKPGGTLVYSTCTINPLGTANITNLKSIRQSTPYRFLLLKQKMKKMLPSFLKHIPRWCS